MSPSALPCLKTVGAPSTGCLSARPRLGTQKEILSPLLVGLTREGASGGAGGPWVLRDARSIRPELRLHQQTGPEEQPCVERLSPRLGGRTRSPLSWPTIDRRRGPARKLQFPGTISPQPRPEQRQGRPSWDSAGGSGSETVLSYTYYKRASLVHRGARTSKARLPVCVGWQARGALSFDLQTSPRRTCGFYGRVTGRFRGGNISRKALTAGYQRNAVILNPSDVPPF